jgi:hypothetical protein
MSQTGVLLLKDRHTTEASIENVRIEVRSVRPRKMQAVIFNMVYSSGGMGLLGRLAPTRSTMASDLDRITSFRFE